MRRPARSRPPLIRGESARPASTERRLCALKSQVMLNRSVGSQVVARMAAGLHRPLARAREPRRCSRPRTQGDAARRCGTDPSPAQMSTRPIVFGATPMSQAAQRGDTAVLKSVAQGWRPDPDSPNRRRRDRVDGRGAHGHVDAAQVLLQAGAKVDARENWGGQTALMWAAAQGHREMIRPGVKRAERTPAPPCVSGSGDHRRRAAEGHEPRWPDGTACSRRARTAWPVRASC